MRLLVVSQYFWPESFRINEVAQFLRNEGCQVTVVTGKPNYPNGQVFKGYHAWGLSREFHPAGQLLRVPLVTRGRSGALLKSAPLVTWVQGLWPESLAVTGFVRQPKALVVVAAVVRWMLPVQSQAFVEPVRAMAGRVPVSYQPKPMRYSSGKMPGILS